jgi:hypothetical protein
MRGVSRARHIQLNFWQQQKERTFVLFDLAKRYKTDFLLSLTKSLIFPTTSPTFLALLLLLKKHHYQTIHFVIFIQKQI